MSYKHAIAISNTGPLISAFQSNSFELLMSLFSEPGILLLAVQERLISAENLKKRLDSCRLQGTHYGVSFIQQVYEMAKAGDDYGKSDSA